ncbi:amino acid permease [Tepidibacillus marianensis]|uniref:amino acid permease n=1 Tax=Tepidibacillus marianensis TaxID=3131995 RepID=UPI00386E6B82
MFAAVWHESQQTGFLSYLLVGSPVSFVFSTIGLNWASGIISAGAIAGITTVLLVMLYGSTRIVFAMSRDGLLPSVFSKLHKKHKTPHVSTIIIGLFSSLIAGFFPIGVLAELVNIGTMFAFVIISVAVIIMRYTQPDLPRKFRAPWVPFTPLLAIIFTGFLMSSLPLVTWIRFIVWLLIGFIIYFSYGYKRSRIHEGTEATVQAKRFLNSNRMGAIHRGSHIFRFYLFTRDFFIL